MSEPTAIDNTLLGDAKLNVNEAVGEMGRKLTKHGLFIGISLLLLGSIGLFLPVVLSVVTTVFISSILFIGGIFWGVHSIRDDPVKLRNWLKPVILIFSAIMMLAFPAQSIDVLAIILAFYLLADALVSFVLAYFSYHGGNWLWMGINGLISLIICIMIIANWPNISTWILGVYIGISLIFDGISLIFNHFAMRKLTH